MFIEQKRNERLVIFINTMSISENKQYDEALSQANSLDETLALLTSQPKRQYTEHEIEEARGNLALMNDRVFLVTFIDNKNNPL